MWRTRCWGSARADNVKSNSPETEGEMYLCNARYLCIWAVQLATRPNWPLVGNFRAFSLVICTLCVALLC